VVPTKSIAGRSNLDRGKNFLSDNKNHLLGRFDEVLAEKPKVVIQPHEVGKLYDLWHAYPKGCDVELTPGEFYLRRTVHLNPGTRIRGIGRGITTLILEPDSNCHMFTNVISQYGSHNFGVGSMSIVGNGDRQNKRDGDSAITFACAFYFADAYSIIAEEIDFFDIRQTALHFNNCVNVVVESVTCRRLGWSGVSTSNASNIYIRRTQIEDAGRDIRHSGIHIDGGVGVYIDAQVRDTTGSGIMLDSSYSLLQGCVVQGTVEGCQKGVSLSGVGERPIQDVVIRGSYCRSSEVGVMISNSSNVAVIGARIEENTDCGILITGKAGGKNCLISECRILNNGTPIRETVSEKLYYFPEPHDTNALFGSDINLDTLRRFSDEEVRNVHCTPWFALNIPKGPQEDEGTTNQRANSANKSLEESPTMQAIRTGSEMDPDLMKDFRIRAAHSPQFYIARIAALQLHLANTDRLDERTNKYISDFKRQLESMLPPGDESNDDEFDVPLKFRRGANKNNQKASIDSAVTMISEIAREMGIDDLSGTSVLDIGCGVKFTQAFYGRKVPVKRYHGVEVNADMIEFLSSTVKDEKFSYKLIKAYNAFYHPAGKPLSPDADIGVAGETFDVVCLFSVFTHLAPPDFRTMLALARKYVSPTGTFIFTAFIDDTIPDFFKDSDPSQPLVMALYKESAVREFVAAAGWSIKRIFLRRAQHWIVCEPV
jgi:SAM-dependent methyltransferase